MSHAIQQHWLPTPAFLRGPGIAFRKCPWWICSRKHSTSKLSCIWRAERERLRPDSPCSNRRMNSSPAASPPAFEFKAARQPVFWAACAYSMGIIAGLYAWRPALWWIVGIAAFVLAAGYFNRRRPGFAWALGLSAFFFAGAVHLQMRQVSRSFDT